MTTRFACVKTGTRYGDHYVRKLKAMIARHMPHTNWRLTCYGDRPVEGVDFVQTPPELPGWWAKLYLFSLGKPLFYFDLDTIIVGDLSRMLCWDGFGILKDPWQAGYGSGIMKLTGNEGAVWDKFQVGMISTLRGDQDWINIALPDQRTFPTDWFPSYKANKLGAAPPADAIAVNFHGFPKPHQITSGWVPAHWRE